MYFFIYHLSYVFILYVYCCFLVFFSLILFFLLSFSFYLFILCFMLQFWMIPFLFIVCLVDVFFYLFKSIKLWICLFVISCFCSFSFNILYSSCFCSYFIIFLVYKCFFLAEMWKLCWFWNVFIRVNICIRGKCSYARIKIELIDGFLF